MFRCYQIIELKLSLQQASFAQCARLRSEGAPLKINNKLRIKMSVYSGFAVRTQEASYNRTLYNLLCLLQLKVVKSLRGGTLPLAHPS